MVTPSGENTVIYLFLKTYFYLFIFWLHWVFVAVLGLSLIAASRGYSLLRCAGCRRAGSAVVAHRL